jgi:hypothetical protein
MLEGELAAGTGAGVTGARCGDSAAREKEKEHNGGNRSQWKKYLIAEAYYACKEFRL